jgi:Tfp pilus assembly protein PilN
VLADLPGWVPPGGAVGLLLLAIWMVLTGRLVAGRTHDRALQRIDKLEAALEKRDAQISELMELSRTAVAALQALPKVRDPA